MFPGDLPQPGWQQVRMGEPMGGAGAPARAAAPGPRGRQPPRGAEISPGFRLPGDRVLPGSSAALRDPPPPGWQRI
ncbi:unnamed protein product [Staurois parvus]|uniref:Uncharacterized protein n=1 Tax=Staurois parvus TaxID=386267 RepID=A0ABN9CZ89_9NEOB|nr:unnamed protein product [Staurois parvus]